MTMTKTNDKLTTSHDAARRRIPPDQSPESGASQGESGLQQYSSICLRGFPNARLDDEDLQAEREAGKETSLLCVCI